MNKSWTEQEAVKASEEIVSRRKKKPAHEVVVEMIRETVKSLNDLSAHKDEVESIPILLKFGVLASLLEILKRMIIPEKHFLEVLKSLREIKNSCPAEYVEKLLPEKFFSALILSQPEEKRVHKNWKAICGILEERLKRTIVLLDVTTESGKLALIRFPQYFSSNRQIQELIPISDIRENELIEEKFDIPVLRFLPSELADDWENIPPKGGIYLLNKVPLVTLSDKENDSIICFIPAELVVV